MKNVAAFAAIILAPTLAFADDTPKPETTEPGYGASKFPAAYAERPLTLPKLMLSPQLGVGLSHLEFATPLGNVAANAVGLDVGASLGITDDLTVYLVPLTMLIATYTNVFPNKVYYGTFRAGATYRFVQIGRASCRDRVFVPV